MSTLEGFIGYHENHDGIRFSWNIFPANKNQESDMDIPLGCLYTPLRQNSDIPKLKYCPLVCSRDSCHAVINPFWYLLTEYKAKLTSSIKFGFFPKNYSGITEQQLPIELMQQSSTIDYVLPQMSGPIILLLVIDTCIANEELTSLKISIQENLENLSPCSLVGLISYGHHCRLHELVLNPAPTSYCFNGASTIESSLIKKTLTHSLHNVSKSGHPNTESGVIDRQTPGVKIVDMNNRFLQPWEKCKDIFFKILNNLQQDSWPVTQGKRPVRCTGSALSLAQTYPMCGGRIMLFTGGPCTVGPGQIIETDLKLVIRSHKDIQNGDASFLKKARQFYQTLATSAAENGHCVDILACCLDQTGIYEMQNLFLRTGGYLVMADSFETTIFKQSLRKILEQDSKHNFNFFLNSTLELKISAGFDICGCVGCCEPLATKESNISSKEIGIGGTNWWKLCSLDPKTTFAFVFEHSKTQLQSQDVYLQFITIYHQSSPGSALMRVTTCARPVSRETNSSLGVAHAFDQDAAAALMTRIVADRLGLNENPEDVMRWIDRTLIHLCQYVAHFQKDDISSFRLPDNFTLYPQYIFHLRRSHFLQYFNNSPDETVFYRYSLNKENTLNTCVMIQPVLYSYSLDKPPQPVLLDSSSIQPEVVLFLDTYFHVLIYLGETIAFWVKDGYHLNPDYSSFALFLEAPVLEAKEILKERMPVPRYIYTEHGASQARFLTAKVNPSRTYSGTTDWNSSGATILTDDISLQAFIDHLKKIVVTQT